MNARPQWEQDIIDGAKRARDRYDLLNAERLRREKIAIVVRVVGFLALLAIGTWCAVALLKAWRL